MLSGDIWPLSNKYLRPKYISYIIQNMIYLEMVSIYRFLGSWITLCWDSWNKFAFWTLHKISPFLPWNRVIQKNSPKLNNSELWKSVRLRNNPSCTSFDQNPVSKLLFLLEAFILSIRHISNYYFCFAEWCGLTERPRQWQTPKRTSHGLRSFSSEIL